MFPETSISPETQRAYSSQAWRLVNQFRRENPGPPATSPLLGAVRWFLRQHCRWADSTVRRYAVALAQELDGLLEFDSFPPGSCEGVLLDALENDRPQPAKTPSIKSRKHLPVQELRAIVAYFRSSDDEFARWCAGYLVLASRLGWRPGEMLNVQRQGMLLVADAEKHTNGRGLTETCQADLSPYGARWFPEIDEWISNIRKFEQIYGSRKGLQANLNARLQTACRLLGIKRVCTYTLRHFAIASMKASGLSRKEIAVLVNHATDRTASDRYCKKRHGARRARRRWVIDQARLAKVRSISRRYDPSKRFKSQLLTPT
jgi:hypothetical protein